MAARNRGGRPRKTASSRAANSARPPPSRGNFRTFCFRARMPWRPARCTHTRPRAASARARDYDSARPLRRLAPRSMHALRPRRATILEEVAEILWGCVSLSSKRFVDLVARGSERIRFASRSRERRDRSFSFSLFSFLPVSVSRVGRDWWNFGIIVRLRKLKIGRSIGREMNFCILVSSIFLARVSGQLDKRLGSDENSKTRTVAIASRRSTQVELNALERAFLIKLYMALTHYNIVQPVSATVSTIDTEREYVSRKCISR